MAYTTINKSTDYFNTKLYTGNGGTQSIDVGFQSDWTWLKSRTETKTHILIDAVRGSNKDIISNSTAAENTDATRITGFDSDGFNLGSSSTTNTNSQNFVSWNWKANGAGSANTAGSINSTVSANTTAGMSIVKYTGNGVTGATIGHGLGKIPTMMIVKNLSRVSEWTVYHKDIGNTHYLELNSTVAKQDYDIWHDTTPTANVFYARGHERVNYSGDNYIAYIFTDIEGYSKFSSYTGNANAKGPFVYTGFKPAFVIIKRTNLANDWLMQDNKRYNINETVAKTLKPNSALAEGDTGNLDILSNGFKLRSTGTNTNASGGSYIYMAFAEQPLVGDNPATAR